MFLSVFKRIACYMTTGKPELYLVSYSSSKNLDWRSSTRRGESEVAANKGKQTLHFGTDNGRLCVWKVNVTWFAQQ